MKSPPDRISPSQREKIASELGVSPRTVTRAIESPSQVSDETRLSVIRTREQLGFGRAPGAIFGLLVPDEGNPFFVQLKKSIDSRLAQQNFQLVTASSNGYEQREYGTIQSWLATKVAGVFYAQNPPFVESLAVLRRADDMSVVLVDVDPDAVDVELPVNNSDAVLADNAAGIERAVAHLVIENGHERLAFLAGPDSASTARARAGAFGKTVKDHQLDPERQLIVTGDYSYESGRTAAIELAKRRRQSPSDSPTAIVASNDLMAIGMMKGLKKMCFRIPEDFSVVGFDNIEACNWVEPELTSIDQRIDKIADRAVRLMTARILTRRGDLSRFAKGAASPDHVPPLLIERKSVAHVAN